MKHLFKYALMLSLGSNLVFSIAKAEETISVTNDNDIYVFATYGLASLDAKLSNSVSSGSLSLTSALDDEGNVTTFGFGWQKSETLAFEVYAGKADGFSATTTLTATNAVIDGNTWNGSLSVKEKLTASLLGANAAFTNSKRFASGSALSFSGKIGLVQHKVEDELSISGAGTVNGVSYSLASPVLDTIKEKGTSVTLGAGLNYSSSDNLELSFGITHIPNVGGGDLAEADLTSYDIGIALKF